MKLRIALLAATVLAFPFAAHVAHAQPISGLYIGAGGGLNSLATEQVRNSPGVQRSGGKAKFDPGAIGVGSLGYGLGNGFRVELEGNYRYNQLSKITGTNFPTSGHGTQQGYGVMANALFDMDIGKNWVYPYIGAGVGYGWTTWNDVRTTAPGYSLAADGTYGQFAYQAMVGASFPIPNVVGLSLTAEYRFYSMLGPQSMHATQVVNGRTTSGNLDFRTDYSNSLLLGVRYAFNVAPPPPPPSPAPAAAPAPAPARTYLVFFDWDKADLTDRARQIVSEAAQASTHVSHTKIQVNGYTDTSGTPAYNQRLSIRRAQAVAAELVKDGVAKTDIAIAGFGETHLLVPTAQGVREPQNRRVEILIQ